jgi:hypothetical protein
MWQHTAAAVGRWTWVNNLDCCFNERAGRNAGPFCLLCRSPWKKLDRDIQQGSNATNLANLMRIKSFILCTACLALSSVCALAGSAATGGPQIAPTDNSAVSTYKVTDTSVGASARDSAGASASQASGPSSTTSTNASSTATDASSSNGTASSNGSAPSAYGISPHATKDSNDVATQIAREKVIDTGDKAVETEKSAKVESRDKTFAPGLLDKVSDISAVGAQKEHGSDSKAAESKSAASEDKNDSHK